MLAVSETVVASLVVGLIALRYGTLHLTVSACIAPFLLLRTTKSTEVGLMLAEKFAAIPEALLDSIDTDNISYRYPQPNPSSRCVTR